MDGKISNRGDVPREEWAMALGRLLSEGFLRHPDALAQVVVGGREKFVKAGLASDRYGLTASEYADIYRRLLRLAKRLGLSQRVH